MIAANIFLVYPAVLLYIFAVVAAGDFSFAVVQNFADCNGVCDDDVNDDFVSVRSLTAPNIFYKAL